MTDIKFKKFFRTMRGAGAKLAATDFEARIPERPEDDLLALFTVFAEYAGPAMSDRWRIKFAEHAIDAYRDNYGILIAEAS